MTKTYDLRISNEENVKSPKQMREEVPLTEKAKATVISARKVIEQIKQRKDSRLLILCGPCSVHSERGADEFAENMVEQMPYISDNTYPIIRYYFDKPRSGDSWKGLANDPDMDNSCDIEKGIRMGRRMIIRYAEMGLAAVTEFVDPLLAKYFTDIVAMGVIGARTASSQPHQIIASGLSMPFGVKNDIFGNLDPAIQAINKALKPHTFLTTKDDGGYCKKTTKGNQHGFLIVRGGREPNYNAENILTAKRALEIAGLTSEIIVDCSHGNSNKQHENQPQVWENVLEQKLAGDESIVGLMMEGYLKGGNQKLIPGVKPEYDISITDECSPWETVERLLLYANKVMGKVLTRKIQLIGDSLPTAVGNGFEQ